MAVAALDRQHEALISIKHQALISIYSVVSWPTLVYMCNLYGPARTAITAPGVVMLPPVCIANVT